MECENESVIRCDDVHLTFYMPEKQRQRIKDVVMSGGRALRTRPLNVLKGVTFDLCRGEILGIIGRNGAGKSTLLRVLGGIYRPDHGHVQTKGRISMMMELGAGFHPDFTGRENVFLNASLIGLPGKLVEERYDRIVEWCGLADFMEMEVRHYSSGMRARLGFAVAVELRPDILLIDEVLSVGDAEFRRRCDEKFDDFVAQGTTIVLVSHSMSDIEKRCTKVMWLQDGIVMEYGDPNYVLSQYRNDILGQRKKELQGDQILQQKEVSIPPETAPPTPPPPPPEEAKKETPPPEPKTPAIPLSHPSDDNPPAMPELPSLPKRWGRGDVKITGFALRGQNGERKYIFQNGESIRFDLHYEVTHPVASVFFAAWIRTRDGAPVTMFNTMPNGFSIPHLEGKGLFCISLPQLLLANGTYLVSIRAGYIEQGIRVDSDVHENLAIFDVTGGPQWQLGPLWTRHVEFHQFPEEPAEQPAPKEP